MALRRGLAFVAAAAALSQVAVASASDTTPVSAGSSGVTASEPTGAPPLSYSREQRRANEWIEDGEDAGLTQNCLTQGYEPLGSAWTGYFGEIGVSPQKSNVYYVKAGWGVSGFPCGGGAGVHVEMTLPAYTQPAISNQNKVRCWYQSPSQTQFHEEPQDCPQNPGQGIYGGYEFDPAGNQGPWPTATGAIFEIWVPVKTTQPLDGLESPDGQPCYTCVYAGIWMIDGVFSPWVWPRQGVQVIGSGSPSNPLVTYPGPAVTDIFYDPSPDRVQARLNANIFDSGAGGTAYFEIGERAGDYDFRGTELGIPAGSDFLIYEDFLFQAGRDFHWRFCFEQSGSGKICGPDQVYSAPPETGIQEVEVKRRTATVYFGSPPVTNMTFTHECKLDKAAYKPCVSGQKFKRLKRGGHSISVRAVDQDGHKDSTPAKQPFKI
jgi:hypothetical protein